MGHSAALRATRDGTPSTHFVVAARGSSDNAAIFFQYLAGQYLHRVVALATPSLFEGSADISLAGATVIAISQSGRSPGITDVARLAVQQGRPAIAVTNDENSPLASSGAAVVALGVGPERSIASTKTFSATWQALAQLVEAYLDVELEGLHDLPDVVEETVDWALGAALPLPLLNVQGLTITGRGVGYAAAAEIALKVREVSGVRAESYAAADFLHGPIGADGDNCTLVLVLTAELDDAVAAAIIAGSREAGMGIIVITSAARQLSGADATIIVPGEFPSWVQGLQAVIVGQVLALRLGEVRGKSIDTSARLKKVTLSA